LILDFCFITFFNSVSIEFVAAIYMLLLAIKWNELLANLAYYWSEL